MPMVRVSNGGSASTVRFYSLGGGSGQSKRVIIDISIINMYETIKVEDVRSGNHQIGYVANSFTETPTTLASISLNTLTPIASFNIPSNAIGLAVIPNKSIDYPECVVTLSR